VEVVEALDQMDLLQMLEMVHLAAQVEVRQLTMVLALLVLEQQVKVITVD
jgi:hypothetical protein